MSCFQQDPGKIGSVINRGLQQGITFMMNVSQQNQYRVSSRSFFQALGFMIMAVALCFANPVFATTAPAATKSKTAKHRVVKKKHHVTKKASKKTLKKSKPVSKQASKHVTKKKKIVHAKKRQKHSTQAAPRAKTYKANTARTNLTDNAQHRLLTKQSESSFLTGVERRLVSFVHSTVDSLRYSVYKMGGQNFDATKGIYIVDCSMYVDNIIKKVFPSAYHKLVNAAGTPRPTTQHYYRFFNELDNDDKGYWNKVEDVEALRPGDVIVFRERKNLHTVSGHIMVVVDKPIPMNNAFLVRVADSAPVGHSKDTRPPHTSGIGIGTLLLKENPRTGQPSAYAWTIGSYWKTNVSFAMARPNVEVS